MLAPKSLSSFALAVAVVMLAACSSGSKSSGASSSTSSGQAAAANSIVVGGVGDLKSTPGLDDGFRARVERFNRAGGVDGRKIKYLGVSDDGQSPSQNQTAVQALVLKDHVFAVAPVASNYFQPQSSDFLVQNQTPYAGFGANPGFCGSPWALPVNGCLISTTFLNASLVDPIIKASGKPASGLRVAIVGQDSAASKAGDALFKTLFTKRGTTVAYEKADVPVAANIDFSPYTQAVLSTHPDLVVVDCPYACVIGFSAAMKAAQYKGILYNFATYLPQALAKQPDVANAIDGSYVNSQMPVAEQNSPAIKQMLQDLTAIRAAPSIQYGTNIGYWTADMLVRAIMATAAKGPLTPQALEQMLNQGYTYQTDLQGGIGPVHFPQDQSRPVPCAAIVQAKGTRYVAVEPFSCYSLIPAS